MSFDKKINILQDIFGDYHNSGSEYLFLCPKCNHHKRKLSFNIDKNKFQCWVCGWGGNFIYAAVKEFGNFKQKNSWNQLDKIFDHSKEGLSQQEAKQEIKLPKEFISLTTERSSPVYNAPREYLFKRGISQKDICYWKMGFCVSGEYRNRIIIPSFDIEGNLNYFVARTYIDDWLSYKNPKFKKDLIFNELNLQWEEDVFVVEGSFDAIVAQNAIPLLGSTLREDSFIFNKIVNNCDKIYIALDSDAKKKEDKIIDLFRLYDLQVFKIDIFPFKDVGEMTKEEFIKRKNNSSLITSQSRLKNLIDQI